MSITTYGEKKIKEIKSRINQLKRTELGVLHLLLTSYIVANQKGDTIRAWKTRNTIREKYGIIVSNTIEANKIRRIVHRKLIELPRQIEGVEVRKNGNFKVPSIEALVLSAIEKLPYGSYVEIEEDNILIEWEDEDNQTLYGEPTQMKRLQIEYIKGITEEHKAFLDINAEISLPLSEAETYFADAEPIDVEKAIKLLEENGGKEIADEIREYIEYGCGVEAYLTNNPAYLAAVSYSIEVGGGKYLFILVGDEHNSSEYETAWIFRKGGQVKSRLVEKLNKELDSNDWTLDRIYHVFPAELDAGAPGDAVVHISLSKSFIINTPEDEVKASNYVRKIIKQFTE